MVIDPSIRGTSRHLREDAEYNMSVIIFLECCITDVPVIASKNYRAKANFLKLMDDNRSPEENGSTRASLEEHQGFFLFERLCGTRNALGA